MRLIEAYGLPASPIDAATEFVNRIVPEARSAIGAGDLPICIVFDPADHTHSAWRRAAVQELAREAAPRRINAVAAVAEPAMAAAFAYLESAPGVTGQYLPLAG